jgi:hypothetical protein
MTFWIFLKIIFKRFFWYIIILLAILFIAAGLFYRKYHFNLNPDIVLENEGKQLTKKVNDIAFLPQDEVPTVARVSNPSLLKDKAFFVDAKAGDVVLIYTNAKKAILYDPVLHKIVNMSVVNIGDTNLQIDKTLDVKLKNQKTNSLNNKDPQF